MKGVIAVACDMNSDFQEAFVEKCPHLTIVFDHFHIVKNFNEKVILLPHPDGMDTEIIGECSLDGNGEIGLMILPEYWRQEYGTDTVNQLMKIARDLGLETVTAQTDPENKACVGLLRSIGFTAKGMGWFIPEEAIHTPEAGLGMSRGMILFSKNIAGEERP